MYTGYTHGDKLVTMYLKTITICKNPPIGKNGKLQVEIGD